MERLWPIRLLLSFSSWGASMTDDKIEFIERERGAGQIPKLGEDNE